MSDFTTTRHFLQPFLAQNLSAFYTYTSLTNWPITVFTEATSIFANEGLMDLERNISRSIGNTGPCITICKGEITHVLSQLEKVRKIDRIFAHEETGHNVSYARDRRVRKWCVGKRIQFIEFVQTGVTRGLKNRDNFTRNFNAFMARKLCPKPSEKCLERHLLVSSVFGKLHCGIMLPENLSSIPIEHRKDRQSRQRGGESEALRLLADFSQQKGARI